MENRSWFIRGHFIQKWKPPETAFVLSFDHVGSGLEARGGELSHLKIAGTDRIFYPAKAVIDGEQIVVSAQEVTEPKAVRYAYDDAAQPNLFNKEGLPASSFRTDEWPVFYNVPKVLPEYDPTYDEFTVRILYEGSEPHEIFYSLNGSPVTRQSQKYSKPFTVKEPVKILARVFGEETGAPQTITYEMFKNKAMQGRIVSQTMPGPEYNGGSKTGLIDGKTGTDNFTDGRWNGYRGKNMEVIIDLKTTQQISVVSARFLEDHPVWIFLPESITCSVSRNGRKYKPITTFTPPKAQAARETKIHTFSQEIKGMKARFIKFEVQSAGPLPAWHLGAGKDGWIFIDEVMVD